MGSGECREAEEEREREKERGKIAFNPPRFNTSDKFSGELMEYSVATRHRLGIGAAQIIVCRFNG
jgi:hypothetical protein